VGVSEFALLARSVYVWKARRTRIRTPSATIASRVRFMPI
jgi:hypothetical protein